MSFGLRVLQCPRIGRPSAAKTWSPNACSSSLFLGATTARTDRPPALFCRSRILMVLPAPGSATIRCQERLSQASCSIFWNRFAKAVSTKMSFLKSGWVMRVPPLAFRGESWSETNRAFPTNTFRQRRGKVWEPQVVLEPDEVQKRMRETIDFMVQHATFQRDQV